MIKFSQPVSPVTPSDIFSEKTSADADDASSARGDENSDTSADDTTRNDMYNPISETIGSNTRHPTHYETSRIVVNTVPVAPFFTCRIRNIARNSLEYDYTDYFMDTVLGPCQIAIHQDVVLGCLKVYYLAMAEALKRYWFCVVGI